jgi:hypothetical protein
MHRGGTHGERGRGMEDEGDQRTTVWTSSAHYGIADGVSETILCALSVLQRVRRARNDAW